MWVISGLRLPTSSGVITLLQRTGTRLSTAAAAAAVHVTVDALWSELEGDIRETSLQEF